MIQGKVVIQITIADLVGLAFIKGGENARYMWSRTKSTALPTKKSIKETLCNM